ncbi:hypothetical protein JT359_17350 [Candidatus Poribacteria bacterium]|nr:hypothetical protein [Candidatus Poribacteria bacterium]
MRLHLLLLFSILLIQILPCSAIYEGSTNANTFIRLYQQKEDFGRLALWHETAAQCITLISIPLNEIMLDYYKSNGYEKWVRRAEQESIEIHQKLKLHIDEAKDAWKKSTTPEDLINKEREKIAKFLSTWLPHYPDRFYEFGFYPTFFRERREIAENEDNIQGILILEAQAAEICAALYEQIPIRNGDKIYEKVRNNYLKHAALLRTLSQKTHKFLPKEADYGKLQHIKQSDIKTLQKDSDFILGIAKSDGHIKSLLKKQKNYHEFTWFQGFAWTVSFYNHQWGNLAIAIVDDQTEKVIDILMGDGPSEKPVSEN